MGSEFDLPYVSPGYDATEAVVELGRRVTGRFTSFPVRT